MRVAQPIELTESEIKTLSSWSRGRRTPTRLMKRAKIVLMAAEGEQNKTIAELLGIDRAPSVAMAPAVCSQAIGGNRERSCHGVAERRPSENRWHL